MFQPVPRPDIGFDYPCCCLPLLLLASAVLAGSARWGGRRCRRNRVVLGAHRFLPRGSVRIKAPLGDSDRAFNAGGGPVRGREVGFAPRRPPRREQPGSTVPTCSTVGVVRAVQKSLELPLAGGGLDGAGEAAVGVDAVVFVVVVAAAAARRTDGTGERGEVGTLERLLL
jgi:hypothetical protein